MAHGSTTVHVVSVLELGAISKRTRCSAVIGLNPWGCTVVEHRRRRGEEEERVNSPSKGEMKRYLSFEWIREDNIFEEYSSLEMIPSLMPPNQTPGQSGIPIPPWNLTQPKGTQTTHSKIRNNKVVR